MSKLAKLLVVGGLVFAAVPVMSASFDCAKAASRIENAICASPVLSGLDSDLDAAYRATLADSSNPKGVRQAQREWLKANRNRCGDEACLRTVYQQRISALARTSIAQAPAADSAFPAPTGAAPEKAPALASAEGTVATPTEPAPAMARVPTPELAALPTSPAITSPAVASSQAIEPTAAAPQGPVVQKSAMADGKSMFMLLPAGALLVWGLTAVLAMRRRRSVAFGIGVGFLVALALIATATAILRPAAFKSDEPSVSVEDVGTPTVAAASAPADNKSEAPKTPGRPSLRSLFDTSTPQATREQMARDFVAGPYHMTQRAGIPSVTNYTFSADGTYTSAQCSVYGEVSERTFESSTGRWTIKERRYGDTGMIYYAIWLGDIPRASLMLDRDDGLQFDFSNSRVTMLSGNKLECE